MRKKKFCHTKKKKRANPDIPNNAGVCHKPNFSTSLFFFFLSMRELNVTSLEID